MPARTGRVSSSQGRGISWVEHGPPDGVPVLYCHGSPGSPAEVEQFHGAELAERLGMRLIVIARPGMWRSEHQTGRRIVDWPGDARCVADACGLDRFALVGYSAGAAYAVATALAMPDRVTAVALVAPVRHGEPAWSNDLDRLGLWLQRQPLVRPRLTRGTARVLLATPLWRPALRAVVRYTPALERPDRHALRDRVVRGSLVHKSVQAFSDGPRGPQHDMALMMQPWTFEPADVASDVGIWHGRLDALGATVAMAQDLHARMAGSALTLVDDGHLSVMTNHAAAVFAMACGFPDSATSTRRTRTPSSAARSVIEARIDLEPDRLP